MSGGEYLLDNSAEETGQRFGALSALFNATTFRHMETLGIEQGWRCWEVGAGGPSVPSWLAARVGKSGQVFATDIDTSWFNNETDPRIEVRRHDIVRDSPPNGLFDLVHARLVLLHIPERAEALKRMVGSLRPGGWLLLEDADFSLQPTACLDPHLPEHHRANKLRAGFVGLLIQRGIDLEYGRKLPRLLREAGLTKVGADAYFPVALPVVGTLEIANMTQIRDGLIGQGLANAEEIDAHIATIADGKLDLTAPPLISAWGQHI
jgi:SAM-dependent methyltransferase